MALPSISITFTDTGLSAAYGVKRGILGLIFVGEGSHAQVKRSEDIPDTLNEAQKSAVERALKGVHEARPSVIHLYFLGEKGTAAEAARYFADRNADYCAYGVQPQTGDSDLVQAVADLRAEGAKLKAVVTAQADAEYVIRVAQETMTLADGTVLTEGELVSRVAGMAAACPLYQSLTYASVPEAVSLSGRTRSQIEDLTDQGAFVFIQDHTGIRVAAGINSATEGQDYRKKIKVMDILDCIRSDMTRMIVENYIGKVTNSPDHVRLLTVALSGYLASLTDVIDENFSVTQDLEAKRAYLLARGAVTQETSEAEIEAHPCYDRVYLKASVRPLDVMEHIAIEIAL